MGGNLISNSAVVQSMASAKNPGNVGIKSIILFPIKEEF
jgi:hypothetical protein